MRTHIAGVLSVHAEWRPLLAPFEIEGALGNASWDHVKDVIDTVGVSNPEAVFGAVINSMRVDSDANFQRCCTAARTVLGSDIVSAGKDSYRRIYQSALHLHIVHELELLRDIARPTGKSSKPLDSVLEARLLSLSPSFRIRESVLNVRRTVLRLQ